MTKAAQKRLETLMPGGRPKFVRVYDNGGETADRYTVVFNGRYRYRQENLVDGRPTKVFVSGMSEDPSHPQGVYNTTYWPTFEDAPEGFPPVVGRRSRFMPQLGRRIEFDALPEWARRMVVHNYAVLWGLGEQTALEWWETGALKASLAGRDPEDGPRGSGRGELGWFAGPGQDDPPEHSAEEAPCGKCGLVYDAAQDVRIMGPEGNLTVHCPACYMMLGHELEGPPPLASEEAPSKLLDLLEPSGGELGRQGDERAEYFDCGGCGGYHPQGWAGDCRDDANRFTAQALDEKHGPDGWEEVPETDEGPCTEECAAHAAGCDGYCDHLEGHRNACLDLDMGPVEPRETLFTEDAPRDPTMRATFEIDLPGGGRILLPPASEEDIRAAEGAAAEALVASGDLAQSHLTETPESAEREERIGRAVLEAQGMPLRYGVRYYAAGTYMGEDWPETGERADATALGLKWEEGAGPDDAARTFEVVTNREVFIQRVEGRHVVATDEEMEEAVATGRSTIPVPAIPPPHAQYVQIMTRGDDGRLRPNENHAHLNPDDATAAHEFYRRGDEGPPERMEQEEDRRLQTQRAVEAWAGTRLGFPSNGIDLTFHWHDTGYCLALMDTGRTEGSGGFSKARVAYLLLGPQPEDVIAEGDDYFPAPMRDETGRLAAADYLALFLARDDGEHELTPRQKLFFAAEADRLADWAPMLEEEEEEHTGTTDAF